MFNDSVTNQIVHSFVSDLLSAVFNSQFQTHTHTHTHTFIIQQGQRLLKHEHLFYPKRNIL